MLISLEILLNCWRYSLKKFKIVTPQSSAEKSNAIADNFKIELESISQFNHEIVIAPDHSEDEFISIAKDADAIFGNGKFTAKIINSLENCKIIALGIIEMIGINLIIVIIMILMLIMVDKMHAPAT